MSDDNRWNDERDRNWGDRYRRDQEAGYRGGPAERRYGAGDFERSRYYDPPQERGDFRDRSGPQAWRGQEDDHRGDTRDFGGWDSPWGGHPKHGSHEARRDPGVDRDHSWDRLAQEGRSFVDKAREEVSSWFNSPRRDAQRTEPYRAERDSGRASEGAFRGRGPRGYRRSDERIREDVSDRLTEDAWLDASDIEVMVQGGEVTLSGTVRNRADKRRAEDAAEHVSGVGHVQNNLRVGGEEPARYDFGDVPPMA